MPDPRLLRTSREIFLASLTGGASNVETWMVDRMVASLEEADVAAGTRIFDVGEAAESVYFMRSGRVRISREGAAAWIYDGRWVFGTWDVVLNRPHNRAALALTDVQILKLHADQFLELLEDSFALARGALRQSIRGVAALEVKRWKALESPRAQPMVEGPLPTAIETFVDRLALFTQISFLARAGVQVLTDLLDVAEERTYAPEETIYAGGEKSGRMHLVLEGEAQGTLASQNLTVRFGPGSMVCGVAAMGEEVLSWEAHAVTKTRTLTIRIEDWLDLMEVHFDLLRAALGGLALAREEILDELAAKEGELLIQ